MENQNADVKLVLEEMRRQFDHVLHTGEILDQKAGAFLVAGGALIVLAMGRRQFPMSPLATGLGLVVAGLYAVAFILILRSIQTRSYNQPLTTDWAEIDKALFNETERDATLTMISGYTTQIMFNQRLNHRKADLVDWGLRLLMATVVLTIVLVIIP